MTLFGIVVITAIVVPILGYVLYATRLSQYITGSEEFFLHSGHLDEKDLSFTFAASWLALGNAMVGLLILALVAGIANVWTVLTWALGFLVLSRHAKQIKKLCGSQGTLHSFLGQRYQMPYLRVLASTLTIIACLGVFALELIVGIALLHTIPGVADQAWIPIAGSFLFTLLIAFYASKGGFYAVVRTDRTQFIFVVLGVSAMLLLMVWHVIAHPDLATQIPGYLWSPTTAESLHSLWSATGPSFVFGILLLQLFLQLGDMGSWQRIIAAEEGEYAVKSLREVSWWTALLWIGIVLSGVLLWSHPVPEGLFPNPESILATQAEPLPSLLQIGAEQTSLIGGVVGIVAVALITAGLASAMLSTADTYLIVVMQTLTQDLVYFRRLRLKGGVKGYEVPDELDQLMLAFGRRFLYVVAFLGLALFWILIPLGFDLLTIVFVVFGSQCVLAPLAVLALREDLDPRRYAIPAVLSGLVGFMATYVCGYLAAYSGQLSLAYWAPVVGVVAPTLTLSIAGMVLDRFGPAWLVRSMLFGYYPVATGERAV